ncbi:hypothetical protein PYW07_001294 [Mythimna separata]|uniref:Peptidase S1 domain-containing protein n=1 Tax=Mythimna separata TaxID=271217 RepID=A0AAD8DVQ6_MYTSE|nr:hypothetical protein PYW07_001294 [Mythimna separata]
MGQVSLKIEPRTTRGDSGSALVVRGYIQIGLVSYKMPDVSRSLVVYTDTGYFYDWITKISKKLYCYVEALGDSGSALVVRGYIQIGLVSYKMPDVSRSLVVYTDTGYFYDWITKISKKLYCYVETLGDSGSALVVRGYIQIGLVSYKMPDVSRSLVVYTNTGYFYDWIKKISKKLYCHVEALKS